MGGSFLKGAVVGFVCAVLGGAAVALAGSGINGVFNLGVSNSVDAKTTLTGASPGIQLQVTNTNPAVSTSGLAVNSASTATTAVFTNTGGGSAGGFFVNAGVKPFTVNSQTKVGNLNADLLDGLDSAALQQRVTGTCAAGTAVRTVNANGSVSCQAVGTGAGGWSLTGNAGTTPGANFLGTTDAHDLVVKTNGSEALRVTQNGDVGIGTTTPAARLEAEASSSGAALRASNTGSGSAAAFFVSSLSPPFTVNTTVKVPGLNADFLDGFSSTAYQENVAGPCGAGSAIGDIAHDGSITCNQNHLRPGISNAGITITNLGGGACARFETGVSGIAVGDTAVFVPDAATWPTGWILEALRADQANKVPINVCNITGATVNAASTVSYWRVKINP